MARVSTILCAADPAGSPAAIERLVAAADEHATDAIAVVGDLSESADPEGYRALFRALAGTGKPAYYVPGLGDAPLDAYYREAHAAVATHYRPRLAVCDGGRGTEMFGKHSLVVAPGSLRDGHFALVNRQRQSVELPDAAAAR